MASVISIRQLVPVPPWMVLRLPTFAAITLGYEV